MFIKTTSYTSSHVRKSKLGTEHSYTRRRTQVHFICDCCGVEFTRPKGSVDPKRLSNNYFHVCSSCDHKRFAQRKQTERRKIWNLTASSSLPVGKN